MCFIIYCSCIALQWCVEQIEDYFLNGGKEKHLKKDERRKVHYPELVEDSETTEPL